MKTLYISDLDGTLLRSDVTLSEFTCRTVAELTGRGELISFATARSRTTAAKVTAGLTVPLPIVAYNGAFIVDSQSGEILHKCLFSREDTERIYREFTSRGLSPVVYHISGGRELYSYNERTISPQTRDFVESRRPDPRDDPLQGEGGMTDGEVFHFNCIGDKDRLLGAYEELRDSFEVLFYDDIYSSERWLEVMPKGADKAAAALRLKEMLGCGRMVAFGDAVNDISLFRAADESYAVANADERLKAEATGVILSNDEDGPARKLRELCGEHF